MVVTLSAHAPGSSSTLSQSPPGSSGTAHSPDQPASHPCTGSAWLERSSLGAVAAALAAPEATHRASGSGSSADRGGDCVEESDRLRLARDPRALRALVDDRQPLPHLAQRGTLDTHAAGLTGLGGTLPFLRLTLKCHCSTKLNGNCPGPLGTCQRSSNPVKYRYEHGKRTYPSARRKSAPA